MRLPWVPGAWLDLRLELKMCFVPSQFLARFLKDKVRLDRVQARQVLPIGAFAPEARGGGKVRGLEDMIQLSVGAGIPRGGRPEDRQDRPAQCRGDVHRPRVIGDG